VILSGGTDGGTVSHVVELAAFIGAANTEISEIKRKRRIQYLINIFELR
jgi:hypothetical protein